MEFFVESPENRLPIELIDSQFQQLSINDFEILGFNAHIQREHSQYLQRKFTSIKLIEWQNYNDCWTRENRRFLLLPLLRARLRQHERDPSTKAKPAEHAAWQATWNCILITSKASYALYQKAIYCDRLDSRWCKNYMRVVSCECIQIAIICLEWFSFHPWLLLLLLLLLVLMLSLSLSLFPVFASVFFCNQSADRVLCLLFNQAF